MQPSKTIFFIHGNSSSSAYWNSACLSEDLSSYTTVCIELPGHGNSPWSKAPAKDYSLKGMAQKLMHHFENEQHHPFILIGHSLGTNIIGEIAPYLPSNTCKGILLTSPTITGKELNPNQILVENNYIAPLYSETVPETMLHEMVDNISDLLQNEEKTKMIDDYLRTDPLMRTYLFQSILKGEYIDEISAIEQLNIPLGVVFGEKENVCNKHYFDGLKYLLTENYPRFIPNAGHYLQFDQPAKMNELYKKFADYCFSL